MPKFTKVIGSLSVIALALSLFSLSQVRAASDVVLGTTTSFAVLAGSGITNTGTTSITGDVGTFPTATESGFGTVTIIGTNHAADATDIFTSVDNLAHLITCSGTWNTAEQQYNDRLVIFADKVIN